MNLKTLKCDKKDVKIKNKTVVKTVLFLSEN